MKSNVLIKHGITLRALSALMSLIILALALPFAFSGSAYTENGSVNYALASNGASYVIRSLGSDGAELEPSFYGVYRDDAFTKLNDGVTAEEENENSSVSLSGTGRTHIIRFDLGQERTVNKVTIRNLGNSNWKIYSGRGDVRSIFKVFDGDNEITANEREETIGGGASNNIIMTFESVTARYITIKILSALYITMFDEIEITYVEGTGDMSVTEPDITQPQQPQDPDPFASLDNYALASNGAMYIYKCTDKSGADKEVSFYGGFTDSYNVKLNDGVRSDAETSGNSVAFAGSDLTYTVQFDLGQNRKVNRIVLRNVKIGKNLEYEYLSPTISVYVNGVKAPVYGSGLQFFSYNGTSNFCMTIDAAASRNIAVSVTPNSYYYSIDEIEIYGDGSDITGTETDPHNTDPYVTVPGCITDDNYALAANGATYDIRYVHPDGSEDEPRFINALRDNEFTKLNDGVTGIGESEGSVALTGTDVTYVIRFDIKQDRTFNTIVCHNMINSGYDGGNRGYDISAFKVVVDGRELTASVTEEYIGMKVEYVGGAYSNNVIMKFGAVSGRKVAVYMKSKGYVLSLDEIEIYYDNTGTEVTYTECTETETMTQVCNTEITVPENYASPSKGARYVLATLDAYGYEKDPAYYGSYRDDGLAKLNDGVTSVGESEDGSVMFCGTSKTHRIKFDLGKERTLNRIVLYNCKVGPIPVERPVKYSFEVSAGASAMSLSSKEVIVREEYNGAKGSFNVILEFGTTSARYVFISITSTSYVFSLDEVGIFADGVVIPKDTSGYVIDGEYLYGVGVGTEYEEFVNNFEPVPNLGMTGVIVCDAEGHEITSGKIGTGFTVSAGNIPISVIIVKGDIDGDGNIGTTDYLLIKSQFLKVRILSVESVKAADTDSNGNIDSTDYLRVKRFILMGTGL
ncbi:MAG: hypothetical protein IJS94_04825 [Clostridia bacterium]|nr:hypothetical protein [Clostridia bacterium]